MFPENTEEIEIFRNDRVNSPVGRMISESYVTPKEEMFNEKQCLVSVYFGLGNCVFNKVLYNRESFLDDFNMINEMIKKAFSDNDLDFEFGTIKYWYEITELSGKAIKHFIVNIH